jgi:hypothetical protein
MRECRRRTQRRGSRRWWAQEGRGALRVGARTAGRKGVALGAQGACHMEGARGSGGAEAVDRAAAPMAAAPAKGGVVAPPCASGEGRSGRAGGRRGRRARREGVWRRGRDRTVRARHRRLEETAQVRGPGVGELGRGARWREEQSEVEEGRRAQGALDTMEQGGRGGASAALEKWSPRHGWRAPAPGELGHGGR